MKKENNVVTPLESMQEALGKVLENRVTPNLIIEIDGKEFSRIVVLNIQEEKKISDMTEKEILRQQLELLAERSKECLDEELPSITNTMISIVAYLSPNDSSVLE